jgi:copper chaperone NosL
MTKSSRTLILLFSLVLVAAAGPGQEDTRTFAVCTHCGMEREAFAHARMLIEYTDGTAAGTCSIHCTAVELIQNRTKIACRIRVGDYDSKKLIDATTASWVVGGSKEGVMTEQAKWAFEKKTDADAFIKKYGGKPAAFNDALHAAYDGLYEDMRVTLDRVKERKAKGWDMCEGVGK